MVAALGRRIRVQRQNARAERKKRSWIKTEVPGERLFQVVVNLAASSHNVLNKMTVGATLHAKVGLPNEAANQAG